jgi:hypothetical protein
VYNKGLCCRTQLLRCQYLYFGTSKESKVSTLIDVPRVEGLGHTEGEDAARELHLGYLRGRRLAYVSIRQHTSAYVSIRQHTPYTR